MLKRKLLVPVIALMFTLNVAIPFAVFAQDTEVPPTIETVPTVFQEPVTIEPAPTAVPTEEPAPVPVPSPVETLFSQVNWTIVILAGVIAFFGFLALVVRTLGVSAPAALWEGGKATVRAVYGDVEEFVNATPDPIDNTLWSATHGKIEELFTEVDRLRTELATTKAQVSANTQDIATTAQTVRAQNVG